MNEEKSSRTIRESDANIREQWLPVAEAALLMGVSARTVQKQAASQKLRSKQEGRRLLVCVESRETFANNTLNNANVREQSREAEDIPEEAGKIDVERLISGYEQEIAFLRARVEMHEEEIKRRDQAEGELRRLMLADKSELSQLREKVTLLVSAAPENDVTENHLSEQDANEAKKGQKTGKEKKWWEIWKRL